MQRRSRRPLRRRIAAAAVVAMSFATAGLCAQQGTVAGPAGTLQTVDGRTFAGTLTVDEQRATLHVGGRAETLTFDIDEIRSFEQRGVEPRPVDAPHRVWLRSGLELPAARLSGKPATGSAPAALVVELPSRVVVELPLGALRAIRHGGTQRPEPTLFRRDLEAPPANEDALHVVAEGRQQRSLVTVTDLAPKDVEFLLRGESYEFGLDGVAAIVFGSNTGFAPDRQPRPRTSVELTTGERLEGRLLHVGDTVRCRLDEGFVATVPVDRVLRLAVASDRLVWLAELTPTVEQTPAFDRVWPWTVDRSVAGPGFVIGGQRFDRGIGLVPHTRLTYDVGGRFDLFEATIGIDDRGGPEAHAVLRVYADGRLLFESEPLVRDQTGRPLRLELDRAKSLTIEADFGKNYDLGDFCAFADARLVQR